MGVQPPPSTSLRRSTRKRKSATDPDESSPSSLNPPPTKTRKTIQSHHTKDVAPSPPPVKSSIPTPSSPPAKSSIPTPSAPPTEPNKPTPSQSNPDPPNSQSSPLEKRPKRFRPHAPKPVIERLRRALSQRMFIVSRTRTSSLSESFQLAGTTGNLYTVQIRAVPSCNCPDGKKSGTCKHILYVLSRVLKAPANLVYQAGLLTSELETIFAHAPQTGGDGKKSNRKPLEDDDCPICYCGFENGEDVVWCKAMCGTNLHLSCFKQWKATKGTGRVTCVMCRMPWEEGGDVEKVKKVLETGGKKVGDEGYVNVAEELGISGVRDISTYSEWFGGNRYQWGGRKYARWR